MKRNKDGYAINEVIGYELIKSITTLGWYYHCEFIKIGCNLNTHTSM